MTENQYMQCLYVILFVYYCTYLFLVSIYSQSFNKLLPLSQIHVNYLRDMSKGIQYF